MLIGAFFIEYFSRLIGCLIIYLVILYLLQDAKGNDMDLSIYKGKVLVIVNVASQWYARTSLFAPQLWLLWHHASFKIICT